MTFRRVSILAGQTFVGAIVFLSIHLTTDAAEAAAFWGLFVFFLLFLIPTDRLNPDTLVTIIKAARGIEDGRD